MPKIDIKKFKITPYEKLSTKEKVAQQLMDMFISEEDLLKLHLRYEGYAKCPTDETCQWCASYETRKMKFLNLIIWLQQEDLFFDTFHYTKIEYIPGKERNAREWQAYERLLMDFIDYIIPSISGENKATNIKNIIYCDHVFRRGHNPSFYILYDGNDVYEFEGLWTEYLNTLEKEYPQMLEFEGGEKNG